MELEDAIVDALNRSVHVEAGNFSGSGVVIITGLVLSCFHCLHASNGMKVDGEEAEIIAVDPQHDLCLLAVKTVDSGPFSIATASLGEMVFSVCNPLSLRNALLFGRVINITDDRVISDIHGAPGVSGSALFNTEGQLVGINHSVLGTKHVGSWYTIAVPALNLKKILTSALRITQPTPDEVEKYGVSS